MNEKMNSEDERAEAARLQEYTALFKNALVYTVVMNNVRSVMNGHDGSVTVLLLSFIVASSLTLKLEHILERLSSKSSTDSAEASLYSLMCFISGLTSNVMVQFTSQLVAEAVGRSLQSIPTMWSFLGAFFSVVLLYIMNKVASGAAISCVTLSKVE